MHDSSECLSLLAGRGVGRWSSNRFRVMSRQTATPVSSLSAHSQIFSSIVPRDYRPSFLRLGLLACHLCLACIISAVSLGSVVISSLFVYCPAYSAIPVTFCTYSGVGKREEVTRYLDLRLNTSLTRKV